jgi:predicted AAA+ superfamily ATPase
MKIIKRDIYLNKLIQRKDNGMIKVITGIRRCGKSFLLFELYYKYLIGQGIKRTNIIRIPLDDDEYEELLDKKKLREYISKKTVGTGKHYIFLDEIQLVDEFEKVLNGLNRRQNLDIYVTGSNSKFLSTDVLTEFRGRGDEVRVRPFTFSEYLKGFKGTIEDA